MLPNMFAVHWHGHIPTQTYWIRTTLAKKIKILTGFRPFRVLGNHSVIGMSDIHRTRHRRLQHEPTPNLSGSSTNLLTAKIHEHSMGKLGYRSVRLRCIACLRGYGVRAHSGGYCLGARPPVTRQNPGVVGRYIPVMVNFSGCVIGCDAMCQAAVQHSSYRLTIIPCRAQWLRHRHQRPRLPQVQPRVQVRPSKSAPISRQGSLLNAQFGNLI